MKTISLSAAFVRAILGFGLLAATTHAELPVTIQVDPNAPGPAIPPDFIGLSYEIEKTMPGANGSYYFNPTNQALINTFHLLGIKSVRVGGNSADEPGFPLPGVADVDNLFAFAAAADQKIIFTFRLNGGSRNYAAKMAKYILRRYQSNLTCFAIGNEPNVFAREYPVYIAEWKNYVEEITSPANAPGARICGPSTTPGKMAWARDFVNDFGKEKFLVLITQHDYPGGSGNKVTNEVASRTLMLSPAWLNKYKKFHDTFVPSIESSGLPFRLEEVNSFFHGGAENVSDTFASALWVLDYMHWWASQGCGGINLHTGESVSSNKGGNMPCYYATFLTAQGGYAIQPIGYGVKAFDLGGRGRSVRVKLSAGTERVNLTAYGVLAADKSLYLTVINKEHGTASRDAVLTMVPDAAYKRGLVMRLTAPNNDISAKSGVTLGGAEIKNDASWAGTWTPLAAPSETGDFTLRLPTATATVIHLLSN